MLAIPTKEIMVSDGNLPMAKMRYHIAPILGLSPILSLWIRPHWILPDESSYLLCKTIWCPPHKVSDIAVMIPRLPLNLTFIISNSNS